MKIVKDDNSEKAAHDHMQETMEGFDTELKKAIKEALSERGYSFQNDAQFRRFAKNRLTNATVEDVPFMNIVYLDFIDFDNLGTMLFAYRNEFKTSFENGLLTTSIG